MFYVDARKAGHVVALSGLVKGGVMSGVLRRIDDPGFPVKGLPVILILRGGLC